MARTILVVEDEPTLRLPSALAAFLPYATRCPVCQAELRHA